MRQVEKQERQSRFFSPGKYVSLQGTSRAQSKNSSLVTERIQIQLEWFSHFLVLSLFPAWARIAISHGRDQGLIAEAVSDHSRSLLVNHLLDITSSDQRVVKPWFTGKLDYSPPVVDLTQAGYKLVGCGKSPD
jgi:anti-sigma factor RsiW